MYRELFNKNGKGLWPAAVASNIAQLKHVIINEDAAQNIRDINAEYESLMEVARGRNFNGLAIPAWVWVLLHIIWCMV